MAGTEVVQRISPPHVFEGTAREIVEHLGTLQGNKRLTLIVPGDQADTDKAPEPADGRSSSEPTFRQIFASAQPGFDSTGMTDEELSEFIEAEVKEYRAQRRTQEQQDR